MAVNLSREKNGYFYQEIIADGLNGKAVLIPNDNYDGIAFTCGIIAGENIGKFQFSLSSLSDVLDGNANWQNWPKENVTGSDYDTLEGPVTAIRGVSVSGSVIIEIVGEL